MVWIRIGLLALPYQPVDTWITSLSSSDVTCRLWGKNNDFWQLAKNWKYMQTRNGDSNLMIMMISQVRKHQKKILSQNQWSLEAKSLCDKGELKKNPNTMSVFTNGSIRFGTAVWGKIIGIWDEIFYFELNAAGVQQQEKRKLCKILRVKKSGSFFRLIHFFLVPVSNKQKSETERQMQKRQIECLWGSQKNFCFISFPLPTPASL